jgi:ADP-ribose pyrophosphatase YjhB (NUDIX family)
MSWAMALTLGFRARRIWWRVRRPVMLGVRVIPVNAAGELLLVRHTYTPGWYFPGGGVDRGETLADAAARELREEVSLVCAAPDLLCVHSFFLWGKSDHVALFVAATEGAPVPDGREIAEARWFPRGALPEGLSPATRRGVEALAARG